MKVLVTGGAGYKGTVLAGQLLEGGHDVTIFDNFIYGYGSVLHLVDHPRLDVVREDVRNLTRDVLRPFDVIFHLAGLSGYPACEANPHSAQLINVNASRQLAELLGAEQQVIYASTTSFYGSTGAPCDEETPVQPVSLYGSTKYEAERILMERPNTIALRFATLFGVSPRMRIDLLVNDFAFKAHNERCIVLFEGDARRTFLHLKDAIAAYVFALDRREAMQGNVYNVGDPALNYTKREIAEKISAATECTIIDSSITDRDPRHFKVAFEKLSKLGFEATHTLEEGIAELLKLYRFYNPISTYATI